MADEKTGTISQRSPTSYESRQAHAESHHLLPHAAQYSHKGSLPNTPLAVSAVSAILGGLTIASFVLAARPLLLLLGSDQWQWARPQLGVYVAALGLFHLLEFWTTAGWNVQKLTIDAFLLNNTNQYHYAHAFGLTEYFLSSYFYPQKFAIWYCCHPWLDVVGTILVVGQTFRSLAMIHASTSFSHIVKSVKHDDHTLVTTGVYAWSRHPSYAGFFYWAVASQLLLGNVVSTLGFAIVLGRFFADRIKGEEKHLVRFFGDDYVQYRRHVGTGLPFIKLKE
ncbi:MAG: hypothetical protein TREMPRED_002580 [Tremellales sp. Tagirdzhanova-0007]|nr:MAG: hypothetical protein TREMPRED_002580 [Tremellales sp. Tagirdzhanova-0007]